MRNLLDTLTVPSTKTEYSHARSNDCVQYYTICGYAAVDFIILIFDKYPTMMKQGLLKKKLVFLTTTP